MTILAFQKVSRTTPKLKLKMIGDGELFDVSKNLVKSLGLENNIILLGGLERKEIIKHLQICFSICTTLFSCLAMEIAKVLPLVL